MSKTEAANVAAAACQVHEACQNSFNLLLLNLN